MNETAHHVHGLQQHAIDSRPASTFVLPPTFGVRMAGPSFNRYAGDAPPPSFVAPPSGPRSLVPLKREHEDDQAEDAEARLVAECGPLGEEIDITRAPSSTFDHQVNEDVVREMVETQALHLSL